MKIIASICIALLSFLSSGPDQQKAEDFLHSLSQNKQMPADSLIVNTARLFMGTPYIANTLEVNDNESLVINLSGVDCMTFVENCLALTLSAQAQDPGFDSFCKYLQQIRYRDCRIDDYTSRLHYSSDWIYHNDSLGVICDITKSIGGKQIMFSLNFMSTHPEAYKHLKAHPEYVDKMKSVEAVINQRQYYYIPKENIASCENKIKHGDLIFFVTTVAGLDISHMGIAYRNNGKLTFIHASSKAMKVIINPEPLADYCNQSKSNKGIIVCRINQSKKQS